MLRCRLPSVVCPVAPGAGACGSGLVGVAGSARRRNGDYRESAYYSRGDGRGGGDRSAEAVGERGSGAGSLRAAARDDLRRELDDVDDRADRGRG